MNKELKKAIIDWLFENEDAWQMTNQCCKEFREFIFDANGQYIPGGEEVSDFIDAAVKFIYPERYL